jgi:16S rRNA (cytosine1402-N4)-methyltransferase
MAVNAEIESLQDLLATVPGMMAPNGRAAFISFHSGEDRLVKQATRQWEESGLCEALTKKPVEASEEETNRNPRSRSAKVRAVKFRG